MDKAKLAAVRFAGSQGGAGERGLASGPTALDLVRREVAIHSSLFFRHIPLLLLAVDEQVAVQGDGLADEEVLEAVREGQASVPHLPSTHMYLVSELCRGGSLMQEAVVGGVAGFAVQQASPDRTVQIGAFTCLQPDLAAWYTLHLLRALTHVHARGIAHRDVKPSNILLASSPFDMALLGDWGSAVDVSGRTGKEGATVRTSSNLPDTRYAVSDPPCESDWLDVTPPFEGGDLVSDTQVLTAAFQAPECITEQGYCPLKYDVWSLGVSVFCMLQGALPWTATHEAGVFEQIADPAYEWAGAAQQGASLAPAGEDECVEDCPPPPGPPPAPAGMPGWSPAPPTAAPQLSAEALAFIAAALTRDPKERPTAAQLQLHPWLASARARYSTAHAETLQTILAETEKRAAAKAPDASK